MMNLLQSILGDSSETAGLSQIAQKFGLNQMQTSGIASSLLPMLAQGFAGTSSGSGGLSSLLGMLHNSPQTEAVKTYADKPELLQSEKAIDHGNGILGQLFGNQQINPEVTQQVATQTGVDHGIIKKVLPLLAIVAFNALRNKTSNNINTPQQSGFGHELSQFLDVGQSSSSPLDSLLKAL